MIQSAQRVPRLSFAWRLGFLYAALFLVVGCYLPYFPVWLDWRKLNADQIAVLLAAPLFTRILCTPVISFIAVVILGVVGEPVAAGVIGSVWAATCTLLATRRQ